MADPKEPRRRRWPFFFGDEFDRIREEMERMMEEALRGFEEFGFEEFEERFKKGGPYVYGFSLKIGPDGKPIIREFGNRPRIVEKGIGISEEREPLVDVIEEKTTCKVIAELPGVTKEDIDLRCVEDRMEIRVDTPERKYFKSVKLPCKVKPETAKATFKNGVLEVVCERVTPKKEEPGKRIKIE